MKLKTQNLKLKTLLVLCLLSVVCSVCSATDWYVSQAGAGLKNGTSPENAWAKVYFINWASLQAGDTVYMIGTFTSQVDFFLTGITGDYVTFTQYDANAVINCDIELWGSDWIKLTNITINGAIGQGTDRSDYLWLDHLIIDNGDSDMAINFFNVRNSRISYCTITNAQEGIWCNNTTIDHCVISNISGSGDSHCIGIAGSGNCVIEYNDLSYANTGITLYGNFINNNIIRYNHVHHMEATRATGGTAYQRGYGIGFEGNLTSSSYTRTGNYVYYNIVHDCNGAAEDDIQASGIRAMFYDNTNYVYNNVVYNCSPNYQIKAMQKASVWQPMGGVFKNNISLSPNNSCGSTYQKHISVGSYAYGYTELEFSNNCYYPDGGAYFSLTGATNYTGWLAQLAANSVDGGDLNSILSDPLFTNVDVNDYSLKTSPRSPCIDAGVWVGISTDKNGNSMSYNPDMGAIEVQQGKKYAKVRR